MSEKEDVDASCWAYVSGHLALPSRVEERRPQKSLEKEVDGASDKAAVLCSEG